MASRSLPDVSSEATATRARTTVQAHFAQSVSATQRFFAEESESIAAACRRMAERFDHSGTLLVMGEGARASDAQHVAVEFVHPVIVGKRALPALALTSDVGVMTGSAPEQAFSTPLRILGSRADIALGLCTGRVDGVVRRAIVEARQQGMLTILLTGNATEPPLTDFELRVRDDNPLVVQEVHETLYHVLWELVHVYFERVDAREIHPHLFGADEGKDDAELDRHVRASTSQKADDICALREATRISHEEGIAEAGLAVGARLKGGAKLLAFGNGGSATDAQDAAADCMAPPMATWQTFRALALPNDVGVVTAIGNDVGFDHVFARQVVAFGRAGDVALGFSTSGQSRNVLSAMAEAKARGLLTIGLSGGDGGDLARSPAVDFCFTAASEHVPRIQEAHATVWHALLSVAQMESTS